MGAVSPRWRQSQKETAKLLGGREQPASGARPAYKGDITAEGLLCEDKYTEKDWIRLQRAWLTKITEEAIRRGVKPMLTFRLGSAGKWSLRPVMQVWVAAKGREIFWMEKGSLKITAQQLHQQLQTKPTTYLVEGHKIWAITKMK